MAVEPEPFLTLPRGVTPKQASVTCWARTRVEYDRIQREDMMQAAVIMASFVYNAAMRDAMFPRKPMPRESPAASPSPEPTPTPSPSPSPSPRP